MSLPIDIVFDALSGVDGSARFSFGATTALASVSGPIAARPAAEHPARATVDVHVRPLSSVPGTAEKHAGTALKGILERTCILARHPRTLVQIVVQALSPSSSRSAGAWRPSSSQTSANADEDVRADVLLAAEINACSLALVNAGSISMRGVVCAIPVTQPTVADEPRIVMEDRDVGRIKCTGCFAFLFGIDQTPVGETGVSGSGHAPPSKMIWTNYRARSGSAFSAAELAEAENVALEGAAAVWAKMKESVTASSFTREDPS